jgi:hypothetical protein
MHSAAAAHRQAHPCVIQPIFHFVPERRATESLFQDLILPSSGNERVSRKPASTFSRTDIEGNGFGF